MHFGNSKFAFSSSQLECLSCGSCSFSQHICPAYILHCLKYLDISFIYACLSLPPCFFSCPFPLSHHSISDMLHVGWVQSGWEPIRKYAYSCLTWKGRVPPNTRPRKWLMRPSYECWTEATGIFKIKPPEALLKIKCIILINFCTSYGPFWERESFSPVYF